MRNGQSISGKRAGQSRLTWLASSRFVSPDTRCSFYEVESCAAHKRDDGCKDRETHCAHAPLLRGYRSHQTSVVATQLPDHDAAEPPLAHVPDFLAYRLGIIV